MFNGLLNAKFTQYSIWFTVFAGLSIILAAVYTLNMIRKVFYGEMNELTVGASDLGLTGKISLGLIVVLIFWMGVYPNVLLDLTRDFSDTLLKKTDIIPLLRRG